MILLPNEEGEFESAAAYPVGKMIEDSDLGAAKWAFENGRPTGRGADTLPGAARLFLPLRTSRGVIGVVGLGAGMRSEIILTPDERRLLDALMDQTAVAIERVRFARNMDEARFAAAAERLRGALLTSLSHDLKTPLASILGAATSLREYGSLFDHTARDELLATIEEEAERLSRFVVNLLDMTRIEAGAVAPKLEEADIAESIASAVQRLRRQLSAFKVSVEIEPELPLLHLDVLLIEQALVNILDNATKYAPAGTTIGIRAAKSGSQVMIAITDEGPGLAEDQLNHVFERFYRLNVRRSPARRNRSRIDDIQKLRGGLRRYRNCGQSHRQERGDFHHGSSPSKGSGE